MGNGDSRCCFGDSTFLVGNNNISGHANSIHHGRDQCAQNAKTGECLPQLYGLDAARAIQDLDARAHALIALIEQMPELVGETLKTAQAIQHEKGRADVLSELAKYISEDMFDQFLVTSHAIGNGQDRACVLIALADRIPEVSAEAFEIILDIKDDVNRYNLLQNLAQPLMKISKDNVYVLIEKSLCQLATRTRANMFSDLAALMPVIIHLGTEDTPHEIYEAVRDVTTWWP
jgi:hypothetical protein